MEEPEVDSLTEKSSLTEYRSRLSLENFSLQAKLAANSRLNILCGFYKLLN